MHTRADAQLLQPQNEQVEFITPPEGAKNGERVGHIATATTSCLHEHNHHCIATTIITMMSIIMMFVVMMMIIMMLQIWTHDSDMIQ